MVYEVYDLSQKEAVASLTWQISFVLHSIAPITCAMCTGCTGIINGDSTHCILKTWTWHADYILAMLHRYYETRSTVQTLVS